MSMIDDDYKAAEKIARENFRKIASQLPRSLAIREEGIFKTLKLSVESPLGQLEQLYTLMDDLYSFFSQYTPCRKGCCYCCYIEVSVSSLEAEYIERKTGIKRVLNSGIREIRGTPCPFLDNGTCSIYQYRPFVCRRHNALFDNPRWCNLDLYDRYKFTQVRFSEVEKSYQLILVTSGSSLMDIRQLFQRRSHLGECRE